MVIHTHPGKAGQLLVFLPELVEELPDLHLAHGHRQLVVALEADALWYLGIEFIKTTHPDFCLKVITCMWKVFIVHKSFVYSLQFTVYR